MMAVAVDVQGLLAICTHVRFVRHVRGGPL